MNVIREASVVHVESNYNEALSRKTLKLITSTILCLIRDPHFRYVKKCSVQNALICYLTIFFFHIFEFIFRILCFNYKSHVDVNMLEAYVKLHKY